MAPDRIHEARGARRPLADEPPLPAPRPHGVAPHERLPDRRGGPGRLLDRHLPALPARDDGRAPGRRAGGPAHGDAVSRQLRRGTAPVRPALGPLRPAGGAPRRARPLPRRRGGQPPRAHAAGARRGARGAGPRRRERARAEPRHRARRPPAPRGGPGALAHGGRPGRRAHGGAGVGGVLQARWGWRAPFGFMAALGLAFLAAALLALEETSPHHGPRPAATQRIGLWADAAALARHRAFLGFLFALTLVFSGQFAFISGSAFVCMGVLGLSARAYGFAFALVAFGIMTGSFLAARQARRLGPERLIRRGAALAAASGLAMAALVATGHPSTA